MYVINKTTSLINRVNKLNEKCCYKYNKYCLHYIYIDIIIIIVIIIILFKKNKMAQVEKCNFKHKYIHISCCPKMPSAVNILQFSKHPYDHETCNIGHTKVHCW